MKTFKYILMCALACGLTTSCIDGDWDEPQKTAAEVGLGNNSIQETNVVTIAQLKTQYKSLIETDYRNGTSYAQITEPTQIKAVVTGNDEQGNLYNEIAVDDGTGALIISISKGGLHGQVPVGSEIVVELNGLYIGNYGLQAVVGVPYTNNNKQTYVSRMNSNIWNSHFKHTGVTKEVVPIDFDKDWKVQDKGTELGGKLVTLTNVSFKGANGEATYADPKAGAGSKSVYFNEYGNSVMLYTSNYAKFASIALPTGKVNVTGIMKRYNNSWEIIIRSLDDVVNVN